MMANDACVGCVAMWNRIESINSRAIHYLDIRLLTSVPMKIKECFAFHLCTFIIARSESMLLVFSTRTKDERQHNNDYVLGTDPIIMRHANHP